MSCSCATQVSCALVAALAAPQVAAAPEASRPPTAPASTASPPATARPTLVRKPDKGFFDDALAVDADRVAFIRTDSASFVTAEILDAARGQTLSSFPLGNPQQIFERLAFAGPHLLVITRDPTTGKRSAHRFDDKGKPNGLVGPATELAVSERGGRPILVTWDEARDRRGRTVYSVAVHDLADLRRVAKPRTLLTNGGKLGDPPLEILTWVSGFTRLLGQKLGGYDKARDIRVPDRAALMDVLSSELIWDKEIEDVYGWAAANGLRRRNPGRSVFLSVRDDTTALELVDPLGYRAPVALAAEFRMYDHSSLELGDELPDGALAFSLTVDPLNPEALARKKADRPLLDLYRVKIPEAGALATQGAGLPIAASHILRAEMDARPVGWALGTSADGHTVVLLRKHKAFSRGGDALEVYRSAP
jgi:hypothetical protein